MRLPSLKYSQDKRPVSIKAFTGINYGEGAGDGSLRDSRNLGTEYFPALSPRLGRAVEGEYGSPTGVCARGKLLVVDGSDLLYGGEKVGTVTPGEKQFAVMGNKIIIWPDRAVFDTEEGTLTSIVRTASLLENTVGVSMTESGRKRLSFRRAAPVRTGDETARVQYINSTGVHVDFYTKLCDRAEFTDGVWKPENEREVLLRSVTTGNTFIPKGSSVDGMGMDLDIRDNDNIDYEGYNTLGYYAKVTGYGSGYYDEENDWKFFDGMIVLDPFTNPEGNPGLAWYYMATFDLYKAGEENTEDFRELFAAGDSVKITGLSEEVKSVTVAAVGEDYLEFEADALPVDAEDAWIAGAVTVETAFPELDMICAGENRLWGVSGDTIYASALGEPARFYDFSGDAGSYAVAVASDGAFTGLTYYSNGILAFKRGLVHKVYGEYPSNYGISTYVIPGVQTGSHKSLQVINEVLYYKGEDGVYAYTGSTPELVSYDLLPKRYGAAAAGTDGRRYYISMQDEQNAWQMLVYDTVTGVWLREDNTHAIDFANLDGRLMFISGSQVVEARSRSREAVDWMAELTEITEGTPAGKTYIRLYIDARIPKGGYIRVWTKHDSGKWSEQNTLLPGDGTYTVPLRPGRTGTLRLRLEGHGGCVVREVTRILAGGGNEVL